MCLMSERANLWFLSFLQMERSERKEKDFTFLG